jgi:hypothetical protein
VCGTKRKRRKDEVEQERMCDAVARRLITSMRSGARPHGHRVVSVCQHHDHRYDSPAKCADVPTDVSTPAMKDPNQEETP